MKYLDKQIEKVVKTRERAKSALIDTQHALANYINSHAKCEPKFFVSESDLDRYVRDCKEYYVIISKCDTVLTELILLKEMNEDL